MDIRLETLTPEKARQLLKHNRNNRVARKKVIQAYAMQMRTGKWFGETAEAIKIEKNGNIIDGQHRLNAIIESNTPVKMLMAYDVPKDAFAVIDTGLKRSAADALHVEGAKNTNQLAGTIRAYLALKKGKVAGGDSNLNLGVFNQDILKEYYKRPKFYHDTLNKVVKWYVTFKRIVNPSFLTSHYLVYREIDEAMADKFFEKLTSGENMSASNPIMQLRDILIQDKLSKARLLKGHRSALFHKAWNAMRQGRNNVKLVYDPNKESFPKPI